MAGGGKGGSKGQQATSGGGVSPQQMAYAQYTFGQNELQNAQTMSRAGMGLSTGTSQLDAGAFAGEAFQLGQMSDADAAAMTSFINNQKNQAQQGLGSIASGLGSIAGGGGSSGGGGASAGF